MANTTKVLFIWEVNDRLKNYISSNLESLSGINLVFPSSLENDYLSEQYFDADIIVGWRPNRDLLFNTNKLSLFINPGAGIQHQIELFKEVNEHKDVTLINGHGNSYFTAQHAVGLLLALMNKIVPHHNWMVEGQWRKGDNDGASLPLRNKTIGLLGYGAVNKKVHRFLSGFDVNFCVLRNDWQKDDVDKDLSVLKFTGDKLDEFLEQIDILISAIPQTRNTNGLIGEKELKLLGKSGLVINVARGIIFDEESLYKSLLNRMIAGAAIDVWYDYNPGSDDQKRKFPYSFPFHNLDNVVLSPHRAASPFSDLKRWDEVVENIIRFHAGRNDFLNVVDLESEY